MKAGEHPLSQAQAEEMFNFLLGSGSFENLFFGDDHIGQTGKWWWRSKCVRPLQKRFLELLKAEQELSEARLSIISADVAIDFVTKEREKERESFRIKISELEGTISIRNNEIMRINKLWDEDVVSLRASNTKLEAILKGLREADDALSFTNEHARAKQIIRDLLNEHK